MAQSHASEKRPVKDLKEHPEQRFLVGDLSDGDLNDLIESIRTDGLHHPIEITPDGIIVGGHQRFRAVKQLGWIEVDVLVRHDLAEAGDDAIVAYLIEDNLHRRQMDPLAVARAYRHLKEIARGREYNELHYDDRRDIRDRIAKRLGGHYSGRTLDRYEQILDMPRAIQDAVISKALPLTMAVKITKLRAEWKQKIAERIEAGEPAKEVLEGYLPPSNSPQKTPQGIYRGLVDALDEGLEILLPNVENVAGAIPGSEAIIDVLERGENLLRRLREAEIAFSEGVYNVFDDDDEPIG